MWILLIFVFTYQGVAITSVDYASKEGCIAAQEKIKGMGIPSLSTITTLCTKDIDHD